MESKVVKTPRGKTVFDVKTDRMWQKYVTIDYRKKDKMGRLSKTPYKKRINLPKGVMITEIKNIPESRRVRISYIKINKGQKCHARTKSIKRK